MPKLLFQLNYCFQEIIKSKGKGKASFTFDSSGAKSSPSILVIFRQYNNLIIKKHEGSDYSGKVKTSHTWFWFDSVTLNIYLDTTA